MRILGIIPARGGSKGVPRKNIKSLGGKPLLAYTIASAFESELLTDCILSSEDQEIIDCAKAYHLEVPFTRPAPLAADHTKSIEVVQHAVLHMEELGKTYDAICLLQVTTPFRAQGMIDAAIAQFISSGADALVSVLPVPHEYNPHWVFEPDASNLLQIATGENNIISRRQDLPQAYHRDGAIYLSKTSCIESGSFFGDTLSYAISDSSNYVNIDTLDDWNKAESLLKRSEK